LVFISQAQLIQIVFLNDFPVVFLQGLFPDLAGILTEQTYKVKRNLAGKSDSTSFFREQGCHKLVMI
jgi:hypothetical protein